MKLSFLLLFVFLSSPSLVAQDNATIKDATISFVFISKDVNGSIDGFRSSSTIDLENPSRSKFEGSVAVESIKTGNFLRDWSLKGGKYFNKDDYPRMAFESTEVKKEDDRIIVKGELTIKGITKTLTIQFQKKGNRLIGTASLYCSDFGIHIKKKREDNKVDITMAFTME